MAFCTACGQPRNAAGRFCTACGAPFGPSAGPGGPVSPGGPAGDPEPELDEAFGGLFAPRRDDPGNRNATARLPVTPAGGSAGGAGGGWPGPGWEHGPGWERGPGWEGGPGHDWIGRPPAAPRTRSRIITAIAGAAAVVAVGGGILGFEMHQHHAQPASSGTQRPARESASQSGSAARKTVVAVAPGVAQNPATGAIVRLLTSYFTAINNHDFPGYQAVLGPQMRRSVTAPLFAAGYRSTSDSAATLTGISTAADGRAEATVTFTSHQDPSAGPDHSPCTIWVIKLFLEPSPGGFLIGPAPPGYHAAHRSC